MTAMLALNVTIEGDKIIIEGLQAIAAEMPQAVGRGLTRIVQDVYRIAFQWLSGAGGFNTYEDRISRSGKAYRKKTGSKVEESGGFKRFTDSGGYPVPIRTGNLRRLLNWIGPGRSKESNGISFTTSPMEAMVYDSALYASVIHDGTGSSAKFGPRQYIDDAFESFNAGAGPVTILDQEIQQEITKHGLGG